MVYYQRIYMETVEAYCELLIGERRFKEVEEVSRNAIDIDPFVEDNHALLLRALIGSNNGDKALEHYNYVNKLFYEELGVKPSQIITTLYKDILSKVVSEAKDISGVRNEMKESPGVSGAIYCTYDEFKMLYRLAARAAQRSGRSILIVLLTVRGKDGKELSEQIAKETFKSLRDTIVASLRKDDIVAKYGKAQFLLMLSNIKHEDAKIVMNRFLDKVNGTELKKIVKIIGQLEAIDPVEMQEWHDKL